MKHYTTHTDYKNIHITKVTSLDTTLVQLKLTVVIPHYKIVHHDETLDMYAALFLSGTKKYSKEALDLYLKKYGISIKISAHLEMVTISIVVRKRNLLPALTILNELLQNTHFDSKEFERKRVLFLEENREDHDNAKKIVHIHFLNLLFPATSKYSRRSLSEQKLDIKKLDPKKYSILRKDILCGEWYVTFVGDTESESIIVPKILLMSSKTTQINRSELPLPITERTTHYETVKGKTNIEVRIGSLLSVTPQDIDFAPLAFGIDVLGIVGGFSGRLMSTVREKHGLTYGIYATSILNEGHTQVYWYIYTFFNARDFGKGIVETNKEIASIVKRGISQDELSIFKEIKRNRFALSHDSNAHRLALYHHARILGYTEVDLLKHEEKRELLTVEEVNVAIKKHLNPAQLHIAAAGPITKDGIPLTPVND